MTPPVYDGRLDVKLITLLSGQTHPMPPSPNRLGLAIAITLSFTRPAIAQNTATEPDSTRLASVAVTGQVLDRRDLLQQGETRSVSGFDLSIKDTPRALTSVSAELIDLLNIRDLNDITTLTPGTFTSSFFGVAGSIDIRGTPGENYFRGVRRVDNPGNIPTPIAASDRLDIVRGPASPIYGPSKIGGYVNFVPKSARAENGAYLDQPVGEVSFTTGSWDRAVIEAEYGYKFNAGATPVGYYLYGLHENSDSYYRNDGTRQSVLQAAFDSDINDRTRVEFGVQYHNFHGNQNAGWNRLSQNLIDNGSYLAGTPLLNLDSDRSGRLSQAELIAAGGLSAFVFAPGLTTAGPVGSFGPDGTNAGFALDPASVRTVQLSRKDVLIDPEDFLATDTVTAYFDFHHALNNGVQLSNKLFFDSLDTELQNSYGFAQVIDTYVIEDQLIAAWQWDASANLQADFEFSPSLRHTRAKLAEDFLFEFLDRRDLAQGPSSNDRIETAGLFERAQFINDLTTDYTDYGLAGLANVTLYQRWHALLGLRYDVLDIQSRQARTAAAGDAGQQASATDSGLSWTASLGYDLTDAIRPYVTAATQRTVITGQGGEVSLANVELGALNASRLYEAGIKGNFLDGRLFTAISAYRQTRTQFSSQNLSTNTSTRGKGIEFEARYVASDWLSLIGNSVWQDVINTNISPGGQFAFFNPVDSGIAPEDSFGGTVFGLIAGRNRRSGIPDRVSSLTAIVKPTAILEVFATVTDVAAMPSGFSGAVRLPGYTVVNLGSSVTIGKLEVQGFINNLFNERYFRANASDLFGSNLVLPERPRSWTLRLRYRF